MNDFERQSANSAAYTQGEDLFETTVHNLPVPEHVQQRLQQEDYQNDIPTARIFVRIPNHAFTTSNSIIYPSQKRETQNQGEIKSEPIKFESIDSQTVDSLGVARPVQKDAANDTDPNLITARPKNTAKCFKCPQCWFASIFEERLNQHLVAVHATSTQQKKTRKCPACDNEFFARRSLEVHLELDHEMPSNEVQSIIDERGEPTPSTEPRPNRIFIKSVDVLRQPVNSLPNFEVAQPFVNSLAPLQEDSELSSSFFIDLIGGDSPTITIPTPLQTPQDTSLDEPFKISSDNFEVVPPADNQRSSGKAKIYIKNVDILKEPIFVPPMQTFPTKILSMNDNLDLNLLPPLDDCPASLDIYDFNTSSEKHVPYQDHTVSDSTPRKPSNALHLRTVDELNLMNMTEVQNLLAPLPEQNTNPNNQMSIVPSSESSKCSDEVLQLNSSTPYSIPDFPYNQDSFHLSESEIMPGNWSNYYNFDDLDASSVSIKVQNDHSNPHNATHFDLNTPQRLLAGENDEDILFVCAQELINDSQSFVPIEKHSIDLQPVGVDNCETSSENDQPKTDDVVEIDDDQEQQNGINLQTRQEIITNVNEFAKPAAAPIPEKGRIYVADNLMEDRSDMPMRERNVVTRGRGRRFGSRTILPRLKSMNESAPENVHYYTCDMDCAYKFRDAAKLEYHKRCHTSLNQKMQCPECNQHDFCSWNTLHTHLWRQHEIDMELFGCDYCSFKTPVYSRLMNTHVKIHSNERNFKCDECEKAFKNAKQLKDHRRNHRLANQPVFEVYLCEHCNSSFGQMKSLKEHRKRKHSEESVVSATDTNSNHGSVGTRADANAPKMLQCDKCSHTATDPSAMRRHKMTHDAVKKYQCKFCDFACVQSVMYKKHIQQMHREHASEILLSCSHCNFVSINRRNFEVHIARHKNTPLPTAAPNATNCDIIDISLDDCGDDGIYETTMVLANAFNCDLNNSTDPDCQEPVENDRVDEDESSIEILQLGSGNIIIEQDNRHKIKVKSDSVLTDPTKFCSLETITIPYLGGSLL